MAKVKAYIPAQKQAHPISQRGRKASLALVSQLLLTLVYLRQYITFLSLGHQFGISESVACENRNRECKIFRIVKEVYRGKHKNYGLNGNLIAGLVNLKRAARNLNWETP